MAVDGYREVDGMSPRNTGDEIFNTSRLRMVLKAYNVVHSINIKVWRVEIRGSLARASVGKERGDDLQTASSANTLVRYRSWPHGATVLYHP